MTSRRRQQPRSFLNIVNYWIEFFIIGFEFTDFLTDKSYRMKTLSIHSTVKLVVRPEPGAFCVTFETSCISLIIATSKQRHI